MIELSVLPSQIKPAVGYVIVEVPYLTKEQKDGMSITLLADTSIGDYTVRSGVIVSSGSTDVPGSNFMWSTPRHVKTGDKVWWVPNATQQLANTKEEQYRVMKHGERYFLSLPYKMLVMKLDGGEYVGLNDYVVSEIVDSPGVAYGQFHRVVGRPLPGIVYDASLEEEPVSVNYGDEVLLRQPRKMFLEHLNDAELPGPWTVFQSRQILAKMSIQPSLFHPFDDRLYDQYKDSIPNVAEFFKSSEIKGDDPTKQT